MMPFTRGNLCALWLVASLLPMSSVVAQQSPQARRANLGIAVPELSLTTDWSGIFRGGITHQPALRALLTFGFTLDMERAFRLHGGTLYASYGAQRGRNGSEATGDFQGFSNIDAEEFNHLLEAWYEQQLLEGRLRIKVGLLDANADFAFVDSGAEFVNSSAGYSPTIFPLPTYPDPQPGLLLAFRPTKSLQLSGGVFRSPNSQTEIESEQRPFSIAQFDLTWPRAGQLGKGRLALGAWFDNAQIERMGGEVRNGSSDSYVIFEQTLWSKQAEEEGALRSLEFFTQWGGGDALAGESEQHVALGVMILGPFSRRSEDRAGMLVTRVGMASLGPTHPRGDESVLELFYRLRVSKNLSIQPDLQLIRHPGGDLAVENTIVGTLRIELSF